MLKEREENTCLFSEEHVKLIKEQYEDWFDNNLREADRELSDKYFTQSGIPIKLIYTPADIEDVRYSEDIGFSGLPPYLRGVYPNMYRGRLFHSPTVGRPGGSGRLQRTGPLFAGSRGDGCEYPLRPAHHPWV